jgi:NTE family protein
MNQHHNKHHLDQQPQKKQIAIALQGGGSHGAFSWGILERILERDIFDIKGFSGTSAGAMNSLMATYGLMKGGNKGAIEYLEKFWWRVSKAATLSPMQPTFLDHLISGGDMHFSPGFHWFNMFTNVFSPYDFNPLDINPLRDVLVDLIDFEELKKSEVKLYVCATNVKKCKPKIFKLDEMSPEALLASACLPYYYKAVEINGEHYWDGGYMGNPPIYPLIDGTEVSDILLLKVNPIEINHVPKTVAEIQDRINDISFNNSLMAEMRMVYFKDRILNIGYDIKGKLRKIHFHAVRAENKLDHLSLSSKFNATWKFLNELRELGHKAADEWIRENYENVGHRSTLDLRKVFN